MLTYREQVRNDILDLVTKVQNQIEMNRIWAASGNPSRFNSEGMVVATRPIPFAFPGGS